MLLRNIANIFLSDCQGRHISFDVWQTIHDSLTDPLYARFCWFVLHRRHPPTTTALYRLHVVWVECVTTARVELKHLGVGKRGKLVPVHLDISISTPVHTCTNGRPFSGPQIHLTQQFIFWDCPFLVCLPFFPSASLLLPSFGVGISQAFSPTSQSYATVLPLRCKIPSIAPLSTAWFPT